ncbi:hypothetical protein Brms1b_011539, partial [Colletotrichum noveboracense]
TMKRHIELNSLRATAAAFLLVQGANAGKVYCANAEEKVVAESNCDGTAPPGTFYMFNSEEELGIGSKVSLKNAEVYDSNGAFEKRHELFPADEPMQDLEDNGFGKRACGTGYGGGYRGGVFIPIVVPVIVGG